MSQSDSWLLIYGREKANISGCFENSTSIVLQAKFPRNGSISVLKFLLHSLKGYQCFLFQREHCLSFKKCSEHLNTMPESFFLRTCFILKLLENKRSAGF